MVFLDVLLDVLEQSRVCFDFWRFLSSACEGESITQFEQNAVPY